VEVHGERKGQEVDLSLVEADGTGWKTKLVLRAGWQQVRIPLKDLRPSRSALLPVGYPGDNNYWAELPSNRGFEGDALRVDQIEQIQLSQKRERYIEPRGQKESFGLASLRLVP
jgi:hypothetical protein